MGCACEAVHGFPCQFLDETEFHAFDGREWCLFHLPLEDAEGNKSPKDSWERSVPDWQRFRNVVFDSLRHPQDKSPNRWIEHRISDLRAVVFPHRFGFGLLHDTILYPDFSYATFGVSTIFSTLKFGDWAMFLEAKFAEEARFSGTSFGNWAWFAGARFGEDAWFRNAHFNDSAQFESVFFEGLASFSEAIFDGNASFGKATFGSVTSFEKATFGGNATFTGAAFGDKASFMNANFGRLAAFEAGGADERRGLFRGIDFQQAEFHGPVNFENRRFTSATSFEQAVFHDIAQFHGCTFHQDMSFHQTDFLKKKGKNDGETAKLERAYRTLKLAMENLRARNEEARFFALEMECHRQLGDVPRLERAFASLYKQVSEYGQSISRPLVYLFVSLGAFALLYWITGMLTNPWLLLVQGQFLYDLAILTLEQLVKPFSVWTRSSSSAQLSLVKSNPLLVPIFASFQSAFNLSLIAVFLLALRRRFKMD